LNRGCRTTTHRAPSHRTSTGIPRPNLLESRQSTLCSLPSMRTLITRGLRCLAETVPDDCWGGVTSSVGFRPRCSRRSRIPSGVHSICQRFSGLSEGIFFQHLPSSKKVRISFKMSRERPTATESSFSFIGALGMLMLAAVKPFLYKL